MKYKTRITQEQGKFIGYALTNDQVVYTTVLHPDPIMVTRDLSRYIAEQTQPSPAPFVAPKTSSGAAKQPLSFNNSVPIKSKMIENSPPPPTTGTVAESQEYTVVSNSTPRRCCGRG